MVNMWSSELEFDHVMVILIGRSRSRVSGYAAESRVACKKAEGRKGSMECPIPASGSGSKTLPQNVVSLTTAFKIVSELLARETVW